MTIERMIDEQRVKGGEMKGRREVRKRKRREERERGEWIFRRSGEGVCYQLGKQGEVCVEVYACEQNGYEEGEWGKGQGQSKMSKMAGSSIHKRAGGVG